METQLHAVNHMLQSETLVQLVIREGEILAKGKYFRLVFLL